MAAQKKLIVNDKSYIAYLASLECDQMRDYIDTMQFALDAGKKDFLGRVEKSVAELGEHRRSEAEEPFTDEAFTLLSHVPEMFWLSTHVVLWSYFEKRMNLLCRHVRARGFAVKKKTIGDPKGYTPLPGEKCLRVLGVRLPITSPQWRRMQLYYAIRNLIVHNRGELRDARDGDSELVRKQAARTKHMEIDRDDIRLSKEFCIEFLETMKVIMTKVTNAIPKKFFEKDLMPGLLALTKRSATPPQTK